MGLLRPAKRGVETLIKKIRGVKGLRRRWMINSMTAIVALILLGIGAFTISASSYYYNSVQNGLEAKAKSATDFFANYINESYEEFYRSAKLYTESFDERDRLELQFVSTNGRIVVSTYGLTAGTSPGTSDITDAIENKQISAWTGRNPSTGERIMAVSSPMIYSSGQVIGVMRYVTSLKHVSRQVTFFMLLALTIGFGVILIIVGANLYFISTIIGRLSEITATAKRIAEGGYGVQIEKKFNDEIGQLADTINDMSIKISQSERVQSEFISSVSHELRTPLTAVTGWAETLSYDEELSEDSRQGVRIMLKESRRLTQLVEDLLEFTRIQDGRYSLRIVQMDIAGELEDSIFSYRELLRQNDIELVYEPSEEELPKISGDPERIRQVFLNVLDNAAKYGREGKKIIASIGREGGKAAIRIRDLGPGIPEAELPHVKYKFYKGSSKERGSGIGLAVCDEIVKLHGGELIIQNAEGGGTLVTILLPLPSNI